MDKSILEFELGELMSDISQQSYCASWVAETLAVCKKIYNGKINNNGVWEFSAEQKNTLTHLRDELGYWVTINLVDDEPPYIREPV